jgi:hypothetical protein
MAKKLNTVLAYVFGVIFIVVLLTIALFVPNPTEAQWYTFKTIIPDYTLEEIKGYSKTFE